MRRLEPNLRAWALRELLTVSCAINALALHAETVATLGATKSSAPGVAKSITLAQAGKAAKAQPEGESQRWQAIEAARSPKRIVVLARSFQRDFPNSVHLAAARELETGASRVAYILSDAGLSTDFFAATHGNASFDSSLLGAARGDADSAFALAAAFRDGKSGVPANPRRREQWLRIAAELGHAGASWDLSEIENRNGRMAEAAHYEKRAIVLGYKPPPRLSNRDY